VDQINICFIFLDRKYLAGSSEEIYIIKQKCSSVWSDKLWSTS